MALVWLIAALTCISLAESRLSPCTTPRGENGDCMRLASCPPLQAIISESWATRDQLTLLKQSTCGYPGEHKVCCPLQPAVEERSSCFTPEGLPGQCISVFHCSHVAERLQSPTVSQEDRAYVNSIRCSSPKGFSVCCGPPPNLIPDASPEPLLSDQCVLTAAPPDPQSQCCGSDGANPNKITDGNATGIDQYPWLALLEYKKGSMTLLMCGGSLISGRYVLTAGHCVAGTLITPTSVRLGEYDTSNPGRDCVAVEGGDDGDVDCTFEPVVIRVERIIPHPEYNPRSPLRRHDIAMLRLAELAPYTYFVRPICLPTTDVTLNFPTTAKLFVAGWGAISEKILSSNIKLHVDLPYKSIATCQAAYLTPNRRAKLWDRQICAGGEGGKDSCKGDSGGPLMYSTGTTYEVVGIVSFGPSPCGLDNVPGVYTKVFEYIAWIRSNIRR